MTSLIRMLELNWTIAVAASQFRARYGDKRQWRLSAYMHAAAMPLSIHYSPAFTSRSGHRGW
jgi:hypothetical protein